MKYYCIGIKGTGMSTLAQILSDLGNQVSGYDDARGHKFTQDGLEERNIPIYYDGNHELDKDTIVTYSVAFKEDHPELITVRFSSCLPEPHYFYWWYYGTVSSQSFWILIYCRIYCHK